MTQSQSNRQNINPQESNFTGESQNINQQQNQPTENEINHKDVSEEIKNDSTDELTKEDKFVEKKRKVILMIIGDRTT